MTIYYRKIYEQEYGPIPKEENGRSYEIHHIDGNHSNTSLDNLKAVTLQEHYDIHYSQGDWAACLLMTDRMKISPQEKSDLAKKLNVQRVQNGTHMFTDSEWQRENQYRRVKNGNHPFVGGEMQRQATLKRSAAGEHQFQKKEDGTSISSDRVKNGTHNFIGGEVVRRQISAGKHASQIKVECPNCGKVGSKTGMMTKHFGNCSSLKRS